MSSTAPLSAPMLPMPVIPNVAGPLGERLGEITKSGSDANSSLGFISKFALMILLIMIVVVCIRIGTNILLYFFSWSTSESPYLIKGMIPATQETKIPQDPSKKNSITVLKSKDEKHGLEFTWSTWLYINDSNYSDNYSSPEYKHIFSKGNAEAVYDATPAYAADISTGQVYPNSSPGLYLNSNTNKLRVSMNTFVDIVENVDIDNIPLNKWLNVIIRVKGTVLDVYINGLLLERHFLSGVPKQNYGDVNIALDGGMDGMISNLRYHNKAIGPGAISEIINSGPNTTKVGRSIGSGKPPYMSHRYYFNTS